MEFDNPFSYSDALNRYTQHLKHEKDQIDYNKYDNYRDNTVIISKLIELANHGVVVSDNQPAISSLQTRQRGYIYGVINLNITQFETLLDTYTDLNYILTQGNKYLEKVTKTNTNENRWDFNQAKNDKTFETIGGIWLNNKPNLREGFEIESFHEIEGYQIINDSSLTFFCVSDKKYGLIQTNCYDKLINAIKMK